MSDRAGVLISGYLDETLTAAEHAELETWIVAGPANAKRIASAVAFHDLLRSHFVCEPNVVGEVGGLDEAGLRGFDVDQGIGAGVGAEAVVRDRERSGWADWNRTAVGLITAACLLAVCGVVLVRTLGDASAVAASVELGRIIAAVERPLDRTYLVTDGSKRRGVQAKEEDRGRGGQPPVDGALLHVRGSGDRYVLVRRYPDGTEFITGSDGETAWAVPPRGRVRVSLDPYRFRGAVPGQQHAIPFIGLRENLSELERAYDLVVRADDEPGLGRLEANRKAGVARGPKRIVIWYDLKSDVIRRMLLDRLPREKNGPEAVYLDLVEEVSRGDAFYGHSAHHAADREVVLE